MRVAILGRTDVLLRAADALLAAGHEIGIVGTSAGVDHYGVGVDDFAALAERAGAAFFDDHRINSPQVVAQLTAAACDVAVSINWLVVVKAEAVDAFPHGILNVHAGDLPRYRGNACPNWAILNGEPHVGLCVHRMEPSELDSGAVLARDRFPLGDDTYVADVYRWIEERAAALVVHAVDAVGRGERGEPQDPGVRPLRCHPRRPEDGRVSWAAPATQVLRLVRASSRPFAGAFALLDDGREVRIWRATRHEVEHDWCAVPGQVVGKEDGRPVVACADGLVRLDEVTLEDGTDAAAAIGSSLRNRLH